MHLFRVQSAIQTVNYKRELLTMDAKSKVIAATLYSVHRSHNIDTKLYPRNNQDNR